MFTNSRSRVVLLIPCLFAALTPLSAAPVLTAQYVGNINGARADAALSFERVYHYTVVAGKIQSNGLTYTFTADVVGDTGYGTITDHAAGTRFQIRVVFFNNGFRLTSNPFGPGDPSNYDFRLVG
jgi:hypothetical protein